MANEEHLAIVRQGIEVWNQWRRENPLSSSGIEEGALNHPDFSRADLRNTDLRNGNFQGVDFSGADLRKADLRNADFGPFVIGCTGSDGEKLPPSLFTVPVFALTDLTEVDFSGCKLNRANFSDARVGLTVFGNVDLRPVQGLDTVKHLAPSTIGIDTLYRSRGDIPEIFLRGCGVPDSMIEYARSLVAAERPIDYYSVFISYSSQNEAVAQRLHADLQAAGVRCWFAPHDLEIGAPIVRGIDEAIRLYDKLLIILSEASVQSRWVEFEVSTALHREVEQGRTMFFPIRLDDTVLSTPGGWAAQLRARHIGDFRAWKDHDSYQAAFSRLLRDLTAKERLGIE
ncbi:MAG TPA: toll/interleukin-1 receptor domain-containing protein [Herpetosiphonaceae bacterium]